MRERLPTDVFTREDRQRYRHKLKRCLWVFERMLLEGMASGEAEDVTPDYLASLRHEAEQIIVGARSTGE